MIKKLHSLFRLFLLITTFSLIVSLHVTRVNAQEQLPNAGFEFWTDTVTPEIWNGFSIESVIGFLDDIYTISRTADSHSGNYAVKVENKSANYGGITVTFPGLLSYAEFDIELPSLGISLSGGVPFNEKPVKLKGYYKFYPQQNTFSVDVFLTKFNIQNNSRDTIARGSFASADPVNEYELFEVILEYADPSATGPAPDSLNIICSPTNPTEIPNAGSIAYIDDIELEYEMTAIGENCENSTINVFPNPASEFVNIMVDEIQAGIQVKLFNSLGQITQQVNEYSYNKVIIPVSDLVPGIYMVQISINDRLAEMHKILIKH